MATTSPTPVRDDSREEMVGLIFLFAGPVLAFLLTLLIG